MKNFSNRADTSAEMDIEDSTKDPQRLAMRQVLVERMQCYINDEGTLLVYLNGLLVKLDMNLSLQELAKMSDELPILKTISHRDKSLMYTELQGFVNQYLEQLSATDASIFDPKVLVSHELQQSVCRQAVKVALGLPILNSSPEWKT